jgi:hypothetical protein
VEKCSTFEPKLVYFPARNTKILSHNLLLSQAYKFCESVVPQVNGRYFEDEDKIQLLQAERVKLLEKDL